MSFETAGYQLLPVLPELVLAAGSMMLLMLGAYRGGAQTTGLVTGLAIGLLAVTGVLEFVLPAGKLTTFGGSFIVDDFARFLKILALIGSAATLVLSAEFLADQSRRLQVDEAQQANHGQREHRAVHQRQPKRRRAPQFARTHWVHLAH